ncbi:MAG: DinB family protein [Bacteroidetes bacterium]|nr:DinB family protein [Bacteroidota bacterium]
MQNQSDFIVKLIVDAWLGHIKKVDALLADWSDEQLYQEIAPGKNSGIYLIGHLAAVHDAMLPILELGQKRHPELEEIFVTNPDKSGLQKPSAVLIRQYWKEINDILESHFLKMNANDWLQKHTIVSAEEFATQPHRNKLNVLINRTNHLANHLGQLLLLKSKKD